MAIREKYAGLPDVIGRGVCRSDWSDRNLRALEGLYLDKLGPQDMVHQIQELFRKLMEGISQRDLGQIINISWNALIPGNNFTRIFPELHPLAKPTWIKISSLPDNVIKTTEAISNIDYPENQLDICKAGGYICLSLLRLFTKSDTNYINAFESIKKSYYNFFRTPFPIKGLAIRPEVVEAIHTYFQTRTIYVNSIAGHLLSFEEISKGTVKGLLRQTFELHLQYTGMHAFPLFQESCEILHCTSEELLKRLDRRITERGVKMIEKILKTHERSSLSDDEKPLYAAKTYKYARLYDEEMFADLQTKACIPLVMILGNIVEMGPRKGMRKPLEMAALANSPPLIKKLCKEIASGVVSSFSSAEVELLTHELNKFSS